MEETGAFTRPENFDSLGYVLASLAGTPRGWYAEVLLKTTLVKAQQQVPPGVALLEETSEGVLLKFYTDNFDDTARYLILFGFPFTIRQPDALRMAVRTLATEALQWTK